MPPASPTCQLFGNRAFQVWAQRALHHFATSFARSVTVTYERLPKHFEENIVNKKTFQFLVIFLFWWCCLDPPFSAAVAVCQLMIRVTRSGDFLPKNVGYFPANLQKFWAIFHQITEMLAISLSKFWFWHFLATFGDTIWLLCSWFFCLHSWQQLTFVVKEVPTALTHLKKKLSIAILVIVPGTLLWMIVFSFT